MMNKNPILETAMNTQRNIASFLLRFTQDLWQDENGEPKVAWRGHIDHVQGEEEITFTDFSEALLFMQKQMAEMTLKAIPTGSQQTQQKALDESFKLWENFAASYSKMILSSLENTMRKSKDLQNQMGEAFFKSFQFWREKTPESDAREQAPAPASPEIVAQLEALQAQVKALTEKIETLENTPE